VLHWDDKLNVTVNIKWLIQLCSLIAVSVYGYLQIEIRIKDLEKEMISAQEEITSLVDKHIIDEEIKLKELEEELKWYQKELNLNPLSFLKRKRK
tara:strand:- start:6956 stop:7240 length:285 start_codon:yes stop_codon:yes gene_type:complete